MRLLVLDRSPYGSDADRRADEMLRAAAESLGAAAEVRAWEQEGDPGLEDIRDDDVVLARADLRSDEDLVAVTGVLWKLGQRGVRCVPSAEGLVATEDKLRTFIRLRHAGVPTPSTVALCAAGPKLGELATLQGRLQAFPVVVKRPVGWGGRGLWRCEDADALSNLLAKERDVRPEGAVLVQPYVAHTAVLSVHAAGGRVVAARRTRSPAEGFSTDVATPSEPASPSEAVARAALTALDACGIEFGAANFLERPGADPICVDVSSLLRLRDPDDRAFAEAVVACALGRGRGGV